MSSIMSKDGEGVIVYPYPSLTKGEVVAFIVAYKASLVSSTTSEEEEGVTHPCRRQQGMKENAHTFIVTVLCKGHEQGV